MSPARQPRRCRIPNHRALTSTGRCYRCRKLGQNRWYARRSGAPFCENGHGLISDDVAADGTCVECGAPPATAPPDPPETWLDWVAVLQVIQGLPLVRPLTKYEMLCAILTVCRRNRWTRTDACAWLRENTHLVPPADAGEYLVRVWAPKRGLEELTLNQAVTYQNGSDAHLAAWAKESPDDADEWARSA